MKIRIDSALRTLLVDRLVDISEAITDTQDDACQHGTDICHLYELRQWRTAQRAIDSALERGEASEDLLALIGLPGDVVPDHSGWPHEGPVPVYSLDYEAMPS